MVFAGEKIIVTFVKNWRDMAVNLHKMLERISEKSEQLARRYEHSRSEILQLEQKVADLKLEIEELKRSIRELSVENESLRVSHKLAPTPNDVIKSRRLIAGLVREIDKCISQLNE